MESINVNSLPLIQNSSIHNIEFEELYLAVRKKECRLYSNNEVRHLPSVPSDHIHFHEWEIRKRSSQKLISYLSKKNRKLTILEVGCGNGWLSARLSEIKEAEVTGVDINTPEIKQAQGVFNYQNLTFIAGDIHDLQKQEKQFDCIIFAASLQYFPESMEVCDVALSMLNKEGEIHILDTYFYKDITHAIERSKKYYQELGFPGMTGYYFHHSLKQLKRYHYLLMFNPGSLKNKFFLKKDPFPWIVIRKKC